MEYSYPIQITGYIWNLMQKISIALSIPMDSIGTSANSQYFTIHLPNELSVADKTILDNIVNATNPCLPPANTGKTTYRVMDLWSMRQWFFTQFGITPTLWFEQGNADGSGECYIHVQFPRQLTAQEKNKIKSVYASSIIEG